MTLGLSKVTIIIFLLDYYIFSFTFVCIVVNYNPAGVVKSFQQSLIDKGLFLFQLLLNIYGFDKTPATFGVICHTLHISSSETCRLA